MLAGGMRVKSLTQPRGTVPPFPCKHHLHMAVATDASAVTARFDVLTAALPADVPVQRAAFSSLQQTSRHLASIFFFGLFLQQTSYPKHHSCLPDSELHIFCEDNSPDVLKVFSAFI